MTRTLLLGAAALLAVVGLAVVTPAAARFIRIDGCLDRGGRYDDDDERCEFAEHRPSTRATSAAGNGEPGDTIRISGPAVIAYFPITQAEADADMQAMEALADFQYYLPGMARRLAACGVALAETYRSPVFLERGDAVERFEPRALEIRVGYRMMNPGLPDRTLEGVHTDLDLLGEAGEYFGFSDECWHGASPALGR